MKRRINLTIPSSLEVILFKIAKRDKVPVSQKAVELIEEALEIEEDTYFDRIASARRSKNEKLLTHEEVWGK